MKRVGFLGRSVLVIGVLVVAILLMGCDTTTGSDDNNGGNATPDTTENNPITAEARYTIEYADPDTADTSLQANTSYESANGRVVHGTHDIPRTFRSGLARIDYMEGWVAGVTTGVESTWTPESGSVTDDNTTAIRVTLELRTGDESDFRVVGSRVISSGAVDISETVMNY